MIKTYDEALKTLNDVRTYLAISRADDCVAELDKVAKYFINEKHKENPTFEQCIKEWNEKGFDVDIYALEISIHNYSTVDKKEDGIEFVIDLEDKTLFIGGEYNSLPYDMVHLFSKTLKTLEEMKE